MSEPGFESAHEHLLIDKVGIRNLGYPVRIADRQGVSRDTAAVFNMYVELSAELKGTHMSRFVELLEEGGRDIDPAKIGEMAVALKHRLGAQRAYVEVTFPIFIEKRAPVSRKKSSMEYACSVSSSVHPDDGIDTVVGVRVPVNAVCPCSKEICEFGAHNQRCMITLRVRSSRDVFFEDVIEIVESCASSDLYSLLKREDEKALTERAYETPVFVEDIVRNVASRMREVEGVTWFSVECESLESIHNHNAFACIEMTP